MAVLFNFKPKTPVQEGKPAWINGRLNEHISQWDAMDGSDHPVIWATKIYSGLSLQAAEKS